MDFKTLVVGTAGLSAVAADALVVVVVGQQVPGTLEAPLADLLGAAIKRADFAFKPQQTLLLHDAVGVKAARLLFVAGGDGSAKSWRKAVTAAVASLKSGGTQRMVLAWVGETGDQSGASLGPAHAQALVMAAEEAVYVYRATKPSAPAAPALKTLLLACTQAQSTSLGAALLQGKAIAAGTALARECANLPANVCTPTYLADEARKLGKQPGLKVEVLERKDCEKLGMGSFLAVAQGSDEPLKFIVMKWLGGNKADAPVVLVGKGITFDTGGISLKSAPEMDEMKFDMGGAASVLGTMATVSQLKLKLNVVGIVAACENMPSGRAVKPGDVVTSMSGQTIEILNTDAEGRLILCDALTYAERFKPAVVVDIATLTGACVVALGHHRSGLFSNDDALAAALLAAGEATADPAWRMPLDEEYDEALKSNFADMGNVGGRAGGAITAAKFLHRFTARQQWAHLDIAGTGWKSGLAKGSTGRPVPLLTRFLIDRAG